MSIIIIKSNIFLLCNHSSMISIQFKSYQLLSSKKKILKSKSPLLTIYTPPPNQKRKLYSRARPTYAPIHALFPLFLPPSHDPDAKPPTRSLSSQPPRISLFLPHMPTTTTTTTTPTCLVAALRACIRSQPIYFVGHYQHIRLLDNE